MKKRILLGVTLFCLTISPSKILPQFNGGSGSGYSKAIYSEGPLPVELVSFSAEVENNKVELKWITATEIMNYGFEVERKGFENTNWKRRGFVEGRGNSNAPVNYHYVDNISSVGKYQYRLKQIDINGNYKYYNAIEVNLAVPQNIELKQNFPNPFNPVTKISFSLNKTDNVKITVFNTLGQQITTLLNEKRIAGIYSVDFDASNLNSGIYLYRLETSDFVQVKKMILLK